MDKLTEAQEEALAEMESFDWYAPYNLDASLETLNELYGLGFLNRYKTLDGEFLFYKLEKEQEGILK